MINFPIVLQKNIVRTVSGWIYNRETGQKWKPGN